METPADHQTSEVETGEPENNTQEDEPCVKKRKGAHGSGWTKTNEFISCNYDRNRRNDRKIKSLAKLLDEWYTVSHTPAVFMAFCNGGIKYYGNIEALKMFCREEVVTERFSNALRTCPENNSKSKDLFKEFSISENWNQFNVREKRKLVKDVVKFETQLSHVRWTAIMRPAWWPESVDFRSPSGSKPLSKDECDIIITSFVENGRACFYLDGTEEPLASEEVEIATNSDVSILCSTNFSNGVIDDLCQQFDELERKVEVLRACQGELEELQKDAFENHLIDFDEIDLKYRCYGEDNFEPVVVGADGNCLYRSISKCLFGVEEKWGILKLGCLLMGYIELDEILEQIHMEYGEHLIDFIEESPTDVNFKSILRNHIQESSRKGAYGGKYNLIINEGILEVILLSRFARVNINLRVLPKFEHFQHFNRSYSFSDSVWGQCRLLCSGTNNPNHFFPLMRCSRLIDATFSGGQCWAGRCCKVTFGDTVICKHCNLQYHSACISFGYAVSDSCGCDNAEIPCSLNWLSSTEHVENNFNSTNSAELKAYIIKVLRQEIKCFRLNNLYRKLLSRSSNTNNNSNWFKTLTNPVLSKLKDLLLNLNLDCSSFSKRDEDVKLLFDEVIIPEVIVFVTARLSNVSVVSIERWIFSQSP